MSVWIAPSFDAAVPRRARLHSDCARPVRVPVAARLPRTVGALLAFLLFAATAHAQGPAVALIFITPSVGPVAGGTSITLVCAGFRDGLTITPGDRGAIDVEVTDRGTASARVPAGAGLATVTVELPGVESVSLPAGLLYPAQDTRIAVTGVLREARVAAETNTLVVRGRGFSVLGDASLLTVGDVRASSVEGVSDGEFRVSVPGADLPTLDVAVASAERVGAILSQAAGTPSAGDADDAGLPDEWEVHFGLNSQDAVDATADFDADGHSNTEEHLGGAYPAGFSTGYLAEGVTSSLFRTRIALFNTSTTSIAMLRFQTSDGTRVPWVATIPSQTGRMLTFRRFPVRNPRVLDGHPIRRAPSSIGLSRFGSRARVHLPPAAHAPDASHLLIT